MTDTQIQKRRDEIELMRLWGEHMYYEAADRGYDFKRGREASDAYYKASVEFTKKYREYFNPEKAA